jgi:phage-related protein
MSTFKFRGQPVGKYEVDYIVQQDNDGFFYPHYLTKLNGKVISLFNGATNTTPQSAYDWASAEVKNISEKDIELALEQR